MDVDYFRTLYDYHYWAWDRVLERSRQVAEAAYFAKRPLDYGSLHGTLVHGYAAEVTWLSRWQSASSARTVDPSTVGTLAGLTRLWKDTETQLRSFLDSLSNADLFHHVEYTRTDGRLYSQKLGWLLAHVANHGTHHRSEVAWTLTQLGLSPGDIDMSVYLYMRNP